MGDTTGWVSELLERRQNAETRKKAAQHDIEVSDQEIAAIDAALGGLEKLATLDRGAPVVVQVPTGTLTMGLGLPLWRWAEKALLEAAGGPLTVPEIAARIEKMGGPTRHTASEREGLRTIMRGKPRSFVAVGDGKYRLKVC